MIIFFDDELAAFAPQMTTLDGYSRQAAIDFVRGIKPGGSTAAARGVALRRSRKHGR